MTMPPELLARRSAPAPKLEAPDKLNVPALVIVSAPPDSATGPVSVAPARLFTVAALAAVMPVVQKVAKAVKQATGADGVRVAQFNEAAAGQTVFHLHFHVIPAYDGVPLGAHSGGKADDAELAALAKAIAATL